jgi:hypothetical protein
MTEFDPSIYQVRDKASIPEPPPPRKFKAIVDMIDDGRFVYIDVIEVRDEGQFFRLGLHNGNFVLLNKSKVIRLQSIQE